MPFGGRILTETELAIYDVLPPELAKRVRVYLIRWLPGRYQGITIGRRIFLTIDIGLDGTSPLLAHELVHVRQWHELGLIGFSWGYVSDFARNLARTKHWHSAYREIQAEQEARSEAGRWYDRRRSGPQ